MPAEYFGLDKYGRNSNRESKGELVMSRRNGQIAILFDEQPPDTNYRPGHWSWVPESEGEDYIAEGYGREWNVPEPTQTPDEQTVTPLPENMPGRDALYDYGCRTLEDVKDIRDWDEVPGIGQVTEGKLEDYFED